MPNAFEWVKDNGGIVSDQSYPFQQATGTCHISSKPAASIDGYENVPPNSVKAMMQAVSQQPVAVAIEADQSAFMLYTDGVFQAPCGDARYYNLYIMSYIYQLYIMSYI